MRASLGLLLLLAFSLPAESQATASIDLANYPFLLRLEHQTGGLNTCVLLRGNGDYHLERTRSDKTSVFEGSLTQEDLARVQHWLDDEPLQQLTKKNIAQPLVITDPQLLQINIFRGDHWQDLLFLDAPSQKPFEKSLTPLVSWIDALHDSPHKELPEEEGKNNCLTPGKIALKTRSQAADAPPSIQAPAQTSQTSSTKSSSTNAPLSTSTGQPFLMRFESYKFLRMAAERNCVVVYPGGFDSSSITNHDAVDSSRKYHTTIKSCLRHPRR